MPFISAQTKLNYGKASTVTAQSPSLSVSLVESALDKKDLTSDKLILLSGIPSDRFYFVAGDKLLIRKYTSPEVLSLVINITKTGWYTYDEFAPAGMKTADYQKDAIGYGYYIEPKEYTGDRYYGGSMVSLMRISSIKFCSRFIHCGSPLAPAGIQDKFSALIMWGEVDAQGNSALKIPAHLEDMSGLFDMGMTIDALFTNLALPKIITLGQPKKMHRTFYNAFSYGMFTYSPPVDAVVFGEMDVSKVTDFSYCFGQCFQANPDIEGWDVSSATNMDYMFGIVVDWTTDKWTRDLSGWCVSNITSEPTGFAQHHPMTAAQKPVWGTCPVRPVKIFNATLWYNEQSMQGDNFRIYTAGFKDTTPIVYNGVSYTDLNTLFGVANILTVPSGSPLRALFDQHNKVVFAITVETGAKFTVTYNYYTVFDGTRQYRNDQYPNLNGFQNKFKPYSGKRAKVEMRLL